MPPESCLARLPVPGELAEGRARGCVHRHGSVRSATRSVRGSSISAAILSATLEPVLECFRCIGPGSGPSGDSLVSGNGIGSWRRRQGRAISASVNQNSVQIFPSSEWSSSNSSRDVGSAVSGDYLSVQIYRLDCPSVPNRAVQRSCDNAYTVKEYRISPGAVIADKEAHHDQASSN